MFYFPHNKGGTKGTGKAREFFLDSFEDGTPFFVLIRRIKKYQKYKEEDEWCLSCT
jgi:hypothetical protein